MAFPRKGQHCFPTWKGAWPRSPPTPQGARDRPFVPPPLPEGQSYVPTQDSHQGLPTRTAAPSSWNSGRCPGRSPRDPAHQPTLLPSFPPIPSQAAASPPSRLSTHCGTLVTLAVSPGHCSCLCPPATPPTGSPRAGCSHVHPVRAHGRASGYLLAK